MNEIIAFMAVGYHTESPQRSESYPNGHIGYFDGTLSLELAVEKILA
jgi:hypothetical protein